MTEQQYAMPQIDPTKNVSDIVEAERRYQDARREDEAKYQNGMREAETKRIDGLLAQSKFYEERIANMLAAQVRESSGLLSTQLTEVRNQLGVRITELEQARYLSAGASKGGLDLRVLLLGLFGAVGVTAGIIAAVFTVIRGMTAG